MIHHVDSLVEVAARYFEQQRAAAEKRDAHKQAAPNIKMVVGPWYLDELGNRTREIAARD
jgi:hypothetical protein